jgi:O-antigen/teichoic acid export membrane protein
MICAVIDGAGIYGSIMHYALVIAFVGSAFLIFLYLWKKGRLDMDEKPKFQMMQDEE